MIQLNHLTMFLAIMMPLLLNGQSFSIQGQLPQEYRKGNLELLAFDAPREQYQTLAILPVDEHGVFLWVGPWPHANLYQLRLDGQKQITLAVDRPEQIHIRFEAGPDGQPRSVIDGSTGTRLLRWFPNKLQKLQDEYFGALKSDLDAAIEKGDEKRIREIEQEVSVRFPNFVTDLQAAAVDSLGTSVAAYALLNYIDPNKGLTILEAMVSHFQDQQPELPISRALSRRLAAVKGLGPGAEAPDFELNDLAGLPLRLADFRGRYLFVDFWASWCLACRAENPKLVNFYRQYGSDQLAMLSVAIKENEDAWRQAVAKDRLSWPQLRDTENKVADLYHIQSLPQNILLNPEGLIIARNLNTEELEAWIKKVLVP